jgi:hypothetical protein
MLPPLLGMRGIDIVDIIDIDQAGFFSNDLDQRFGKTVLCQHCSQKGIYGKGEKVNLLLAICGDDVGRMRSSEMVLCPILWGINLSHIYAREVG